MAYKILFCGTPLFAVPSMMALHASRDFSLEKVYTQPDRPSGRGKKMKASPVKKAATDFNILVETPEKISTPEIIKEIRLQNYDLAVVVAYGQMLSQDFLDSFKFGCVNVHSSLLPRWRGAAPMQRAIMAGDLETGVSLQKVVKKLDAGDIISEVKIELPLEMGCSDLYENLSQKGAKLLLNSLVPYMRGELQVKVQDESQMTYAKKIEKQEGLIDWQASAFDVHNKIRGLDMGGPYAFTSYKGKNLKIHKSIYQKGEHTANPGMIIEVKEESIVVACSKDKLELLVVQPESKAKMSVADFIRGYHVKEGDDFES